MSEIYGSLNHTTKIVCDWSFFKPRRLLIYMAQRNHILVFLVFSCFLIDSASSLVFFGFVQEEVHGNVHAKEGRLAQCLARFDCGLVIRKVHKGNAFVESRFVLGNKSFERRTMVDRIVKLAASEIPKNVTRNAVDEETTRVDHLNVIVI